VRRCFQIGVRSDWYQRPHNATLQFQQRGFGVMQASRFPAMTSLAAEILHCVQDDTRVGSGSGDVADASQDPSLMARVDTGAGPWIRAMVDFGSAE
jgi:hypothetical protein